MQGGPLRAISISKEEVEREWLSELRHCATEIMIGNSGVNYLCMWPAAEAAWGFGDGNEDGGLFYKTGTKFYWTLKKTVHGATLSLSLQEYATSFGGIPAFALFGPLAINGNGLFQCAFLYSFLSKEGKNYDEKTS